MSHCLSRRLLLLATVLTASACVTINIYFPAAAAEKAADRIIDEVWQARNTVTPAPHDPAAATLPEEGE